MKIAFVHSNNDDVGGSDLAMWRLVRTCFESGYAPLVILSRSNPIVERYRREGVKLRFVPMPRLSRSLNPFVHGKWFAKVLWSVARLVRVLREERVEVIFGNDINELPAALAGKFLGIGSVTRLRWVFLGPDRLKRWYLTLLLWASTRIASVSNFVDEANFHDLSRYRNRRLVLYDWYQGSPSGAENSSMDNPFAPYGIPQNAKVVLMPGRMEPFKGQHVLVEAAPMILNACPDTAILFVGATVKGRGRERYRDLLVQRCRELGVSDSVFFSDHVDKIDPLIEAAAVLTHCTTGGEPFGLTVLEGLWHGTPVIASKLGGPLETVGSPPAALLCEPGNPKALADAVIRILQEDGLASDLASRGKDRAQRFSKERLWPEFEALFRELATPQ